YYMNTYGIHSIHGRAPTLATGLEITNPDLSVWVITGDGDALSIGGNHILHACRRNANINIILFNNRIYGLTKGQYSPTSLRGTRTKSSPMGSLEQPLNPISVALSAEASFIARSVDVHTRHLQKILKAATAHKGTSFVEILQNCLIFNDGTWKHVTDRKTRAENILQLEHGKPMLFGKNRDKGIRMNGMTPEVVQPGNGITENDLLVHDQYVEDPSLTFMLSRLGPPQFPTPLGIFRSVERPTYSQALLAQMKEAVAQKGQGNLRTLLYGAETWVIDEDTQVPESKTKGTVIAGINEEYIDEIDQRIPEPSEVEHSLENALISELNPASPIVVAAGASLAGVITTMQDKNIGSILVVDMDGKLIGVFTERDVLNRVACEVEDLAAVAVGDYMTSNPIRLGLHFPIAHALNLMANDGFRHLPLVDKENKPVGVISFRDVVKFIERWFA
ncbi:MAG: thiamine pyrophosphate-dependent enzyme, partial [Anaerolineales bacterium]